MPAPPRGKFILVTAFSLTAALTCSCTVLQVPVSPPSLPRSQALHLSSAGIEINAIPLRDVEVYWELFDDNLPEIGIVALWLELRNAGSQAMDFSGARWELRRGENRIRAASTDDVFKQYYQRRRVRLYRVNADHQARQAMSNLLFKPGRIEPLESHGGFLFFKSDAPQSTDWARDCVLAARNLPPEAGERRTLALPLFHANP